ncbi:MAG TPA: 2-aminobenzoate-CoA ligase, partial [Acetobacteraceae bacterium]|nr:2-aminobenzoate-CoA ligase [Acetobacteraceae bacterium]
MDSFARDNLPPREQWPDLLLDRPEFRYPARLNCVAELVDKAVARGQGDRPAFRSPSEQCTYRDLADKVARI